MKLRMTLLALAIMATFTQTRADEDAGPDEADTNTLETVSVIGRGETRQVQHVTARDMEILPPGTSPLKALDLLPGVHFESADPFGNYEWSTRISLRGFNQNRLGFTLDGIPLGDMSYGNDNGLHISRALISENLAQVELAQGIGSLGTASTNNLGGTIQFFSADPLPAYGVRIAQTLGSDSAQRTYARIDTGDHGGFSMYLSGDYADTDKWKGSGDQQQSQVNAKAVYAFGGNRISLMVNTSRRDEVDYADLSLDSQRRLGWDWDNYQPEWQRAVDTANYYAAHPEAYPTCAYTTQRICLDDAYYLGRGVRDDNLANLAGEFALAEGLAARAQAYYHNDRGQGHWFTPYQPSSPTVPISIRTTEYGIDRSGVIASLAYDFDDHHLEGGFWYENSGHNLQRNYYFVNGPIDDSGFLTNPDLRVFYQHFDTTTRQFYVQDSMHFLDGRLTVDAGFKSADTRVEATSLVGTRAAGELTAKKNFLPQVGVGYKLTDSEELFASYAENLAAFQPGVGGPFSSSQAAFDTFGKDLKPEESKTLEGGARSVGATYEASVALYTVKFDNRLLAIARCAGIVGCAGSFANVGSASSRGAELTFVWKPIEHLRWFNSVSYNRSRYDSDYVDGTNLIQTDGKTTVDSPKQLFASEIAWQQGGFDARLGAKYTDKRFITYLNDSSVPSFWLVNASLAYDFGKVAMLDGLRVQLNVTNLADKHYFATVGSNGFVASDPQGLNWTLLTGAPRQAFLTLDARF